MKCRFLGCNPFKMFPVYRQVAVESKTHTTSYFGTIINWGGAYFQPQIGIRCACEENAMVSIVIWTLNFLDTPHHSCALLICDKSNKYTWKQSQPTHRIGPRSTHQRNAIASLIYAFCDATGKACMGFWGYRIFSILLPGIWDYTIRFLLLEIWDTVFNTFAYFQGYWIF